MGNAINFSLHKEIRRLYQPKRKDFLSWVSHSLLTEYQQVSIEIIIVSKQRSAQLNKQYRQKDTATNVISLEYDESREKFNMLYGELILCDEIIVNEAISTQEGWQQTDILNMKEYIWAHYAHMVVHGVLHLQGLDHQDDAQAEYMEQLESNIMRQLGYKDPYRGKM